MINTRKLQTVEVDDECIAAVLVNQSYFKSLSVKRDEHDRNIIDSTLAQVCKQVNVSLGGNQNENNNNRVYFLYLIIATIKYNNAMN